MEDKTITPDFEIIDESEWLVPPKANRAIRRACAKRGHIAKPYPGGIFCWECGETLL